MRFDVLVQAEAEDDLVAIYDYVLEQAGRAAAERFVDRINQACSSLRTFPARGAPRDDLAPGLRLLFSVRRVVVAYQIRDETVLILGILYAGRNYSAEDFSAT